MSKKNQNQEEFIMKPKVDFCFKELMEDEIIRKGFIEAVLGVPKESIGKTIGAGNTPINWNCMFWNYPNWPNMITRQQNS